MSPILALFINLCIEQGTYPDKLKSAIIKPIYKHGSHKDYTNYRPIALLSVINKIVEKYIIGQMGSFLEENNILSNSQHGFRRGRSTATALAQFTDEINGALDKQKQVGVIFIDFKKAFDTLEHEQLLEAAEECGIAGPLNKWLRAYLAGRTLCTVVDGCSSTTPAPATCGVPTGSVCGPVAYIMHVNSMSNVVKNCKIYMYADDTCLVYADKDLSVIEKNIQEDFTNIVKWAHDNGIIINISKTKCMIIRSPYLKSVPRAPHITGHSYECLHRAAEAPPLSRREPCACAAIEVVSQYKYLGLTVDSKFSWSIHISNLCDKLRAVLVKFHQLSFALDRSTMYTVYYALVDSLLSYGLACYGHTFKTHLNKVKALQIRFMKLLVDKKTKYRCSMSNYEKLFIECKMLPVHERAMMLTLLDQYGSDEFKNYVSNRLTTRNATNKILTVPTCKNYYGKRTRKYLIPKLTNTLPLELKTKNTSKKVFKRLIRDFLLQRVEESLRS